MSGVYYLPQLKKNLSLKSHKFNYFDQPAINAETSIYAAEVHQCRAHAISSTAESSFVDALVTAYDVIESLR